MNRKIIAYKDYFNTFFAKLDKGTQDKVLYILMLLRTQDRLPAKFIKAVSDGLFEVRIELIETFIAYSLYLMAIR